MLQKYLHIYKCKHYETVYACLDTGLTPDASQPRQCIKRKQSSIANNILKHFGSFEKGYVHQVLN